MKKFRYLIDSEELDESVTDNYFYQYFDDNKISYENRGQVSLRELYLVSKINSLGENGWELVNIIQGKEKITFYFKKEI